MEAKVKWKVCLGSAVLDMGVAEGSERDILARILARELGQFDLREDRSYAITVGGLCASAYGDEFSRVAGAAEIDEAKLAEARAAAGEAAPAHLFPVPRRKKTDEELQAQADALSEPAYPGTPALLDALRRNKEAVERTLGVPSEILGRALNDAPAGSVVDVKIPFPGWTGSNRDGDVIHPDALADQDRERERRAIMEAASRGLIREGTRIKIQGGGAGRDGEYLVTKAGPDGIRYKCPHDNVTRSMRNDLHTHVVQCDQCGASRMISDVELMTCRLPVEDYIRNALG